MELIEFSATELSRRIAAREIAPSEVMQAYLRRIERLNPGINALVSLRDPDILMAEARVADDAAPQGWLHGLPMAPKDLMATRGLRTTWGSPLYAGHIPDKDDLIAARMRAAGAIFIGKSNTPEWGFGSHTFNEVFGPTRNPYDLRMSAGGSSGGAAAALAAQLLPLADGSDMMGSLRNPAGFCNVYGFRPSWGRVPGDADGDTFLRTMATEGPMGRTVEDVARLLSVQSGPNPETPFGLQGDDFAANLGLDLHGLRIGWLSDWGGAYSFEPGILSQCEAGLTVLADLGAVVEPLPPPFPAEQLWRAWTVLRSAMAANGMRALYEDPARRARLKPEAIWEIEQGLDLSARAVFDASLIRSRWYAHAARIFERFDAIILPVAQVWPFPVEWRYPHQIAGQNMDTYHRWMEVVIPASLIGLPALSVPVGFGANELAMGMQIVGPFGADARVLAIGHQYHLATEWPQRRPAMPVSHSSPTVG
jgi:amidase